MWKTSSFLTYLPSLISQSGDGVPEHWSINVEILLRNVTRVERDNQMDTAVKTPAPAGKSKVQLKCGKNPA